MSPAAAMLAESEDRTAAAVAAAAIGAAAPRELRFELQHQGGQRKALVLQEGEISTIGRGRQSALMLDSVNVSGQHVELKASTGTSGELVLLARDLSRNGTAVLMPREAEERRLDSSTGEEVIDGAQLILPLRRDCSGGRCVVEVHIQSVEKLATAAATLGFHANVTTAAGAPPEAPVAAAHHAPGAVAAGHHGPGAGFKGGLRPGESPIDKDAPLPDSFDPVTGTGRWRYEAKLGEGGLGVVYRAVDCVGAFGDVAVKVLKPRSRNRQHDARFVFEMHRECSWSLWWLHNEFDSRYDKEYSQLFAKYHEDFTGFKDVGPIGFDAKRKLYESPNFDWERDGPTLPKMPYVVMELVSGEALHTAIDREWLPARTQVGERSQGGLSGSEKRSLLLQAARALWYLERFALIHRDFRGCNMHVIERSPNGAASETMGARLKVLDLGIMICADQTSQQRNTNDAVQAFKKRGETEEKRRRYDWLPWEVRAGCDGTGPPVNFGMPKHSFDMFSLGVLMAHMLVGRAKARAFLDSVQNNAQTTIDTRTIGIEAPLLLRMVGRYAQGRPRPHEVMHVLQQHVAAPQVPTLPSNVPVGPALLGAGVVPALPAANSRARTAGRRDRSRSRDMPPPARLAPRLPTGSGCAGSPAQTSVPTIPGGSSGGGAVLMRPPELQQLEQLMRLHAACENIRAPPVTVQASSKCWELDFRLGDDPRGGAPAF